MLCCAVLCCMVPRRLWVHKPILRVQSGTTPLYVVAHFGNLACLKLLLDKGAVVNKQSRV
jgi:ankyrin repeat protein